MFAATLVAVSAGAMAAVESTGSVKTKIENMLGLDVTAVADSPVPGLLQLTTNRGLFYTTADGKYFMQGRIFNLDAGMRNETESAISKMRVEGLKAFVDDGIVFKAENEKYVVDVFTDITCGYCRQLHEEIGKYNDQGITVRYLAFPRAGVNSETYHNMVSVWCAKDPQQAMTDAKRGSKVEQHECKNNIAEQYEFAQSVGVNGTPYIILPNGHLIGGYQPAAILAKTLENI